MKFKNRSAYSSIQTAAGRAFNFSNRFLDLIFHPEAGRLYGVVQVLWLGGLFLGGALLWVFFLNNGHLDFDFLDWAEVNGPRMAILQDAARQGVLPLHTNNPSGLRGVTDRFLSIADTPFSAQFYALSFLSLAQFMVFNILLLYALGFAGLLLLHHQQRLSLFVTTLLFLMFNFNGHLISHLAVGHTNWTGHLLLPFFVLLLFQLVERVEKPLDNSPACSGPWDWIRIVIGRLRIRWICAMALVMLVIFLQGDFHLYVWCLIFLGLMGIAYPGQMPTIIAAGAATLLVSMVRILPPVIELGSMDSEFKNGFSSVLDILASVGVLYGPGSSYQGFSILNMTAIWEKDTYIGLLGMAFLAVFGIYFPLKTRPGKTGLSNPAKQNPGDWNPYARLLFPALALTLLSYGTLYKFFALAVPVPILSGERVTSRFLILPVLVVAGIGAIFLQRWINRSKHTLLEKVVYLGLLFLAGLDLLQHLKLWRLAEIAGMVDLFPRIAFDPGAHGVASRADPLYTGAVVVGGIISLAAIVILSGLAWREHHR